MSDTAVIDDDVLVKQAQADPDAFAVLYQRYLNPVYRYLLHKTSNTADAEDLTAQVFTEALEGVLRRRYRSGRCFAAWLFTIARNRAVDFYRRKPASALVDDPPDTNPGMAAVVEAGEDLRRLDMLLGRLDEPHRELIRLRYAAGLSFAQIALLDGRSEAAVKMTFYRTLESLRAQWEDGNG